MKDFMLLLASDSLIRACQIALNLLLIKVNITYPADIWEGSLKLN